MTFFSYAREWQSKLRELQENKFLAAAAAAQAAIKSGGEAAAAAAAAASSGAVDPHTQLQLQTHVLQRTLQVMFPTYHHV